MVCAAPFFERSKSVVLVSHNPVSVFTTTPEHVARLKKKPDGHFNRDDLITLVNDGHAVMYDEADVRAILQAIEILVHGCPPLAGGVRGPRPQAAT
jgi:hypothetical protein